MPDFVESRESTVADAGFTLLRVAVGLTFVAHGFLKAFVFGHAGTVAFFTQVGAPFPGVTSVLITALECVGGLALAFGLFTRVLAFLLACDMVGAILLVKLKGGFFAPAGAELEILLLACALAFALGGGGPWSLDALLDRRHHR